MNRKTIILGVVIALALVGLVVGVQMIRAGPAPSAGDAACGYPGCGWTGRFRVRPGDTYPPPCPNCGRPGVLPLSTCKQCGNRQVLNELLRQWIPGSEETPAETRCARCGGPIVHGD